MGRAGRGGGGGSSHSSSHSSSSRSHSSSRSYSSSSGRASRGTSSSFNSRPSSGGYHPSPPRPPHYHSPTVRVNNYYGGFGYGPRRTRSSAGLGVFIAVFILIILFVGISMAMSSAGSAPASTVNREKLELGYGYRNDNVIDEIGWINNPSRLSRDLQEFYNKTGVQPYIVLLNYIPGVTGSDNTEYRYAEALFDEMKDNGTLNEGCMLLVYFDTDNPNTDGASQMILGYQTESVMDAEAVDIFWAYYNQHFFSNEDEDAMFKGMFNDTASRIMQKSTTGMDVVKWVVIGVVVAGVIVGVVIIMKTKRRHEAERAAETQQILSTPLHGEGTSGDSLLDQYSDRQDN